MEKKYMESKPGNRVPLWRSMEVVGKRPVLCGAGLSSLEGIRLF